VPGEGVQDDGALPNAIDTNLASYGHPTGTAPNGAVKEVPGLRVVESSIIPRVPSAATNLTTVMVAEHNSDGAYRL
jgi:choline dehydrogenase